MSHTAFRRSSMGPTVLPALTALMLVVRLPADAQQTSLQERWQLSRPATPPAKAAAVVLAVPVQRPPPAMRMLVHALLLVPQVPARGLPQHRRALVLMHSLAILQDLAACGRRPRLRQD